MKCLEAIKLTKNNTKEDGRQKTSRGSAEFQRIAP